MTWLNPHCNLITLNFTSPVQLISLKNNIKLRKKLGIPSTIN
jgi:hypothetical protein